MAGNDIGIGITTYLLQQASVRALISDRLSPDVLPKGCLLPAGTITIISDEPDHHLLGLGTLTLARVQFDFYADTRRESVQIDQTVKLAISGQQRTMGNEAVRCCNAQIGMHDKDQPTDGSDKWRYIVTRDYLVWYVQATS